MPTQQPDPPGLAAQLTDGLVARYIRPSLWSGIMLARVSGRNIKELVTAWRAEIDEPAAPVLEELSECDRQARIEVGELVTILQDRAAPGEKRVLAAAFLLGREDISPRDALYAEAMLIDAGTDYDLLRDTAGEAFADLTRKDWRRFCDNPSMLRSPRLYVDTIRRTCEESGSGWPSAARIILAALPATGLTIPGSIRAKLDDLARRP